MKHLVINFQKINFWKILFRFCFCFCFLITITFGQTKSSSTPQPTPPAQDDSVVKITTNLIQIDATVTDKNGKTVTGLTADDFEIYENDKKQPITNFSYIEIQNAQSFAATAIKPNKNSIQIPPVPLTLRPEQVRRTIALVVDDLSLSFVSADVVKSSLKKFVDEQMQPGDLVTIIKTSSGTGALQQFTSDKRMLYAAIAKIRWYPLGRGDISAFQTVYPGEPTKEEQKTTENRSNPTKASDSFDGDKIIQQLKGEAFTTGTLGAVSYVIRGMSQLPGRKAVLLFSDGFNLSTTVSQSDGSESSGAISSRIAQVFQRLTDLANRSSVVIYGIDPRGLAVPVPGADDSVCSGDSGKFGECISQQSGVVITERSKYLFDTQQGLKYLSEQTGGFAVINNNNLNKGIERVLNDQKSYYLLGYEPDEDIFDPRKARFNKLTVKLKRPDLTIRYRSGFFGVKDEEARPQPKTPQQQILAALTSPFNSGDIDLQLTSLYANDDQTGDFMRSVIYINGKDLTFSEDIDGWEKATFDIVAMTFGENGNVVDEVSRTETIKARSETLREIREKGFVSTVTVPVKKPGAYQMRVVMRDASTSRIGSASQFIEVPNLKKKRLTLSGILLQRVQPLIINTAAKPFQPDEQRDIAIRSFSAGTSIRFGYAIYNATLNNETKSPNLVMQFRIFKDGRQTFASKEKSVKLLENSDLQRLMAEGVFELGKTIQPGDYVLQVIVRDLAAKEKNKIATQWIDFEVN